MAPIFSKPPTASSSLFHSACRGEKRTRMMGKVRTSGAAWCSVQFSCSIVSDSLWPHGLQHARPPCPSPTPGVCSNSCSLCWWCHLTISSSVVPFSSHLQSFPASGSFPMSWLFALGGLHIGASASMCFLATTLFMELYTCTFFLICTAQQIWLWRGEKLEYGKPLNNN